MKFADDEYVTATPEARQGHGSGALPVFQLHYAVSYNSSSAVDDANHTLLQASTAVPDTDDQKASNVCARHYAETFLIRLFTLGSWLNELCATQRPPAPRVIVHTIVVVRVYGALVSILTFAVVSYVNTSSRRTQTSAKANLC